MFDVDDRWVVVSSRALGDLCDLVSRALPDLDGPLRTALIGALAEVRTHLVPEPA